MRAAYVNPFAEAAVGVFQSRMSMNPERGEVSALASLRATNQVNLVCEISGGIEGVALFGMSILTADRLAARIIKQPVVTFDQAAARAIAELGRLIAASAETLLQAQGYECKVTSPVVTRGGHARMPASDGPALIIPLTLAEIGAFEIGLCLRENAPV